MTKEGTQARTYHADAVTRQKTREEANDVYSDGRSKDKGGTGIDHEQSSSMLAGRRGIDSKRHEARQEDAGQADVRTKGGRCGTLKEASTPSRKVDARGTQRHRPRTTPCGGRGTQGHRLRERRTQGIPGREGEGTDLREAQLGARGPP